MPIARLGAQFDPEVFAEICGEKRRQAEGLEVISS
jgi:hypothetical protein